MSVSNVGTSLAFIDTNVWLIVNNQLTIHNPFQPLTNA